MHVGWLGYRNVPLITVLQVAFLPLQLTVGGERGRSGLAAPWPVGAELGQGHGRVTRPRLRGRG